MFIVSNSGKQSHNWNLIGVTIKSNVVEEAPCFSWKSVHCSCPDSQLAVFHIIYYTVHKFKNILWRTDNYEVASPLPKFVHLSSLSWLITTDRAVSSFSCQYSVELLMNHREIHCVRRRSAVGAFSGYSQGFSRLLKASWVFLVLLRSSQVFSRLLYQLPPPGWWNYSPF